jgi:hypothetical protein
VKTLLRSPRRWEVRSAGKGSKGSRRYAWAWIAAASGTHSVLVRRHLKTGELAFHYCCVPEGQPCSKPRLIRAAGLRWPVDRHPGSTASPPGPGPARRSRPHPAHRPAGPPAARRRDRPVMAPGPRRALGHLDPPPPGPLTLVPQTRQTRPRRQHLPGQLTIGGCRTGRPAGDMPTAFPSGGEAAAYGRYTAVPSQAELDKIVFLDNEDRKLGQSAPRTAHAVSPVQKIATSSRPLPEGTPSLRSICGDDHPCITRQAPSPRRGRPIGSDP